MTREDAGQCGVQPHLLQSQWIDHVQLSWRSDTSESWTDSFLPIAIWNKPQYSESLW
jgi:hypothetical protein